MSRTRIPNLLQTILSAVAFLLVSLGATVAPAQDGTPAASAFVPTAFEVFPGDAGGPPVVVGTAEPGATIELLDGTRVIARAEANALGEWIALPQGLEAGTHRLVVRTTSADGRFQVVSEQRVEVAINDEPPEAPAPGDTPGHPPFTIADFDVTITVDAGTGAVGEGVLSSPRTMVVRIGDTLWDIAERVYGNGTFYRRILEANSATVPNVRALQPGQILIVPPLAGR